MYKSIRRKNSKTHLVTLCSTRFVERHTAVVCLRSLLPYVLQALDEIKTWQSNEVRKNATNLQNSILQSDFFVCLVILEKISSLLLPITRSLQTIASDLVEAMTGVNELIKELEALRSEERFSSLFREASSLASKCNITIMKPRTANRSIFRAAAQTSDSDSAEEYYRINVFYPALDTVVQDIRHRFGPHQQKIMSLNCLIPTNIAHTEDRWSQDWLQVEQTINEYMCCEDPSIVVQSELELWRRKWSSVPLPLRPNSALTALQNCSQNYPNTRILLQLLATLTVTTAEAERLFSKMERTLTSIRSSMEEKRLEAILLLQAHRDSTPTISDIIDRFAETEARRLKFILY